MKDKKRRLELFSIYDHTGIETHLENMAAKGWLLESISPFVWIYRHIEPRKLHFAVSYYPKADDYDPEPSEAQKTFHDFCEHSGWILAAGFNKMQIFYNERENPIPIETDPVTQVNTIHKAMKKSLLPNFCIPLIFCFMVIRWSHKELMENPIDTLLSTVNIVIVFNLVVLAIFYIVEAVGYIIWDRKARMVAKQGEFLPTPGHRGMKYAALALITITAIYYIVSVTLHFSGYMIAAAIVIIAVYIYVVDDIKSNLKSMKVKASTNKVLTTITSTVIVGFIVPIIIIVNLVAAIVGELAKGEDYEKKGHTYTESYEYKGVTFTAYHDTLPLTVGDLTGEDDNNYSRMWEEQKSLLICQYTADQDARRDLAQEMPSLKYTITKVKIPATYDLCFNQLYNDHDDKNNKRVPEQWKRRLEEIDTEPWRAKAAYQVYIGDEAENTYIICWDGCIVEMDAGWQLTKQQMGIIAEKLNGI